MARISLTQEEILRRVPHARAEGDELTRPEPRATEARFDSSTGRIIIELANGCAFAFPFSLGQGLSHASPGQLGAVELDPEGEALHWEELDVDISVPGIIARLLRLREWAPRLMGQATSAAKAEAARANGLKGGRPASPASKSASKTLRDGRTSATSKSAAGSALSQKHGKGSGKNK